MTHTYNITGMTCGNCVAKAKSQLLMIGDITAADIKLTFPQATIEMTKHVPVTTLQNALSKAGNYTITEVNAAMHLTEPTKQPAQHTNAKPRHTDEVIPGTMAQDETRSWINTYKPILLIGVYITGATLLLEALRGNFEWHRWMRNFMSGFFLVFSFFKLLDLGAFADSFSTYDIIAKRWRGWGYLYAFLEVGLGVAFLVNFSPIATATATFAVMAVSIIGVAQSVLNKRKIQCACLGAFFNLPMSTITIIEDAAMLVMSSLMLLSAL